MLGHLNRVQQMIPPNLEKLFAVRIYRINEALAPGLYLHDWYCSSFDNWIEVRWSLPLHKWQMGVTKALNCRNLFMVDKVKLESAKHLRQ